MKNNIRITLEYDGSRYDGWQKQGNTDNTIQGKLENVLFRMAGEEIEVHGSGRTDAGVHARGQVANFHINAEICPDGEAAREYLNRYLPDDIRVLSAKIVPERYHSRLSATSKTYGYYVETGDKKNVFERKYVYGCGKKLDVKAMRQAAEFLIGEHDFKSFCANRRMKKSTVLPMMAVSLLTEGRTEIRNVPRISDVFLMAEILRDLGCQVMFQDDVLEIDASGLSGTVISEKTVGKMRSSSLLLGPLLSRAGEVTTWYPGGCVIGKRPIDFHLDVLRAMGAEILDDGGMLIAKAKKLCGTTFRFPYPSVGATENALMAAALASGTTKLLNCAREPEIVELCSFLRSMGAKISGERTGTITVDGVEKLFPTDHVTAGDRICAGTYLAAAAAAGGEIEITGVDPVVLVEPLKALRKMGAGIRISGATGPKARIGMVMERRPAGVEIDTGPYPGFPTDLQSVFLAVEAAGSGESRFKETVYEARFEAAMRLAAFGADVSLHKDTAIIRGRYPLVPGIAETPDLRGGAALLVAALAADGLSVISDSGHLKRGYEDIGRDLRKLGADIEEDEL